MLRGSQCRTVDQFTNFKLDEILSDMFFRKANGGSISNNNNNNHFFKTNVP